MFELLTAGTPNGWKASIMLEELGLPYTVTPIALSRLVQKEDWYVALNPNGRIPTLVDHDAGGFAVFESGAILMYLAETSGRFLPADPRDRSQVVQWVMWQMSALGPMMGQATVFNRYFEDRLPKVIDRYARESRRLFGVLDARLAERDYICGDYSIADIACYPWVRGHEWAQVPIDGFAHLRAWYERVGARPAVQRGLLVPEPPAPDDFTTATVAQGKSILS